MTDKKTKSYLKKDNYVIVDSENWEEYIDGEDTLYYKIALTKYLADKIDD